MSATASLAAQAFHPGTAANHACQVDAVITFCDHYNLDFTNTASSTLCYYIIHLTSIFNSSKSIRNYVSKVRFLHKQLSLVLESLDSFPVSSLLRAADLTMRTALFQHLAFLSHLLTKLCQLSSSLGSLGPPMKFCLTFWFLQLLRQSTVTPPSANTFNPTRNMCRAPLGILLIVRWTKTIQAMGRTPILCIPQITNYPADPVAAFTK